MKKYLKGSYFFFKSELKESKNSSKKNVIISVLKILKFNDIILFSFL